MSKRNSLAPLAIALSGVAAGIAYGLVIRPWMLRWGVQPGDLDLSYQGEGMLPNPKINSTHAITIDVPPSKVWPWLVQIGQNKAGFYSYDFMENLAGLGIHNADEIVPEWQELQVGDQVMLAENFGFPVVVAEPQQALVLHGDTRQADAGPAPVMRPGDYLASTWGFYLYETEDGRTRLVERWLADWNATPLNDLAYHVFLEPVAFLMQRRMLLGLKERAERL